MNCFKKYAACLSLSILCAGTAGAQTMVKFATLAPEGSTWMKAQYWPGSKSARISLNFIRQTRQT